MQEIIKKLRALHPELFNQKPIEEQKYRVVLPAPESAKQWYMRCNVAHHWCVQHVPGDQVWHKKKDLLTDDIIFSFSNEETAQKFARRFLVTPITPVTPE